MHADDATHHEDTQHLRVVRHVPDLKLSEQQLSKRLRIVDELHRGKPGIDRFVRVAFFTLHSLNRSLQLLLLLLFRRGDALRG